MPRNPRSDLQALASNRSLRSGHPLLPVTRFATTMHHSNNQDKLGFDSVQDAIREEARETTTDILLENLPTLGAFQNSENCVLNSLDEP